MYKRIATYLLAALSLTACVDESYDGGKNDTGGVGGGISFSNLVAPYTRAMKTGKEAADALGGKFYVYGIKNENTLGAGNLTDDNLVFKNYVVKYTDGSANTTTSNTAGWEYVGNSLTTNETTNLTDNIGTDAQLIKYWDTQATDYTFYALAVANNDLEDGYIKVEKINDQANQPHRNGYKLTVTADADPTQLYVANRQNITSADYGKNVTFSFHNAMAKVRVAMYETIPGYSLTIDAFRVASDAAPTFAQMTTEKTTNFAANLQNAHKGTAGNVGIIYHEATDARANEPMVVFYTDKDNILTLGDNLKANTQLGTDAARAVYDKSDKSYTPVYPMENNVNNLKLKVDFTLKATTGESITVKNATAEVPASFLQWKPGYAYTYIFKISDQTNATIGSLTGLYPITFDALAIVDGTGKEEEISTIGTEANIVTMGYDADTKLMTINADDYSEGNTIYASVIYNKNLVEPTSSNTKLYIATTSDAENYPVTEANVSAYLTAYAVNADLVDQPVTVYEQTLSTDDFVSTVPMGDGSDDTRSLSAVKWTAGKHVYAVEYTNGTNKYYKIVKVDGYNGRSSGTLTLTPAEIENSGGTISPSLTVDGTKASNASVTYALGSDVPSGVTISDNGTENITITVPGQTASGTYHLTATYNRRTYTTTFTVKQ